MVYSIYFKIFKFDLSIGFILFVLSLSNYLGFIIFISGFLDLFRACSLFYLFYIFFRFLRFILFILGFLYLFKGYGRVCAIILGILDSFIV